MKPAASVRILLMTAVFGMLAINVHAAETSLSDSYSSLLNGYGSTSADSYTIPVSSPDVSLTDRIGSEPDETNEEAQKRALLAYVHPDYPVSPGDVYVLSFMLGNEMHNQTILVDAMYTVNMGIFGSLAARDLLFQDFRSRVENQVAEAYPDSSPNLAIRSCGVFKVQIGGEVAETAFIEAWGLSRLSSLRRFANQYASQRRVLVRSNDGSEKSYDLFKASRQAGLSEDPYLKSGDTVIFTRAEKNIHINGSVRRPGTYELLPGETLQDLLYSYADGPLEVADLSRIQVKRSLSDHDERGRTLYLDAREQSGFELQHLDSIHVYSRMEFRPVVFFEGAISNIQRSAAVSTSSGNRDSSVTQRLSYPFSTGETLSSAVHTLRGRFSDSADLRNAYLIREGSGEHIAVNLEDFLYRLDYSSDLLLEENDIVVIPVREYFVTVTGAVNAPGRYPYAPDRGWDYYVGLAGGINSDRNSGRRVTVIDSQGLNRSPDQPIQPEDSITVPVNDAIYRLNRITGIVTAAVSVTSLILTILNMLD